MFGLNSNRKWQNRNVRIGALLTEDSLTGDTPAIAGSLMWMIVKCAAGATTAKEHSVKVISKKNITRHFDDGFHLVSRRQSLSMFCCLFYC